jgi:hypothetical protein
MHWLIRHKHSSLSLNVYAVHWLLGLLFLGCFSLDAGSLGSDNEPLFSLDSVLLSKEKLSMSGTKTVA